MWVCCGCECEAHGVTVGVEELGFKVIRLRKVGVEAGSGAVALSWLIFRHLPLGPSSAAQSQSKTYTPHSGLDLHSDFKSMYTLACSQIQRQLALIHAFLQLAELRRC
jgi:hypothetical protein